MFEENLLKFIKSFTMLTIQLFGLWPYHFDSTSKTFTTNAFFLMYSMAFPFVSFILFVIYFRQIFYNIYITFASFAITLIDDMYMYLLAIAYATLYVGNHLKFGQIKSFLIASLHVFEWKTDEDIRYLRPLILFLLKSLMFDCLYNFLVITGAFQSSDSSYANFFGAVAISLCPTVVRVVPNLYYGCILVGHHYYHKINNRIKSLSVSMRTGLGNEFSSDECISDEFDKLCMNHKIITKLINECNQICSLQVVIYIIIQVNGLLLQIIVRVVLLRRDYETDAKHISFNIILFVALMLDFYTTFAVCDQIVCEVNLKINSLFCSILDENEK